MQPYQTVARKELLKGAIVDVVRDTITLPNGKTTERELVLHGDASAILPIDNNGDIIFARQYRHPVGKKVLEIPAGMIDEGESPLDCAARELEEETAYISDKITFMFSMYSSIGFCDEILHIYLAENLRDGVLNLDFDEFVTVEKYSLNKSIEMIFNNEIIDGKTISAIFAYNHMLNSQHN